MRYLLGIMVLLTTLSCEKKVAKKPDLVPDVTTINVKSETIALQKEYVGQISGIRDIEVRARVGGILLKRYYAEGAPVKAGDPLFLIDPEPYKIELAQAKSIVKINEARFENARRSLNRILPLYKENAVSQKDRDDALAEYQQSKSALETARSNVNDAQINLGYTTVRAPISGYSSKESVAEGSLIVTNVEQSRLTIISQIDPAYVNFTYSEADLLELTKSLQEGKLGKAAQGLRVRIKLADGTVYPNSGTINFNDIFVDPTTGTIRARAVFKNPEHTLRAGQFVRVYVEGFQLKNSIAVPKKAVLQTQKGPQAYIVDSKSLAQQVALELGQDISNNVIIEKGLKVGDRLIVEGASKVRSGQKVKVMAEAPSPKITP